MTIHYDNILFIFPKSLELMKLEDDELEVKIGYIRDKYKNSIERNSNSSYEKKVTVLEPFLFKIGIPTKFMMKHLESINYFSTKEEVEKYVSDINILRHRVIELIYK